MKSKQTEEFYIFTHPYVRDIAEQRWKEIAAAMDRQWPEGAGEDQLNTLDMIATKGCSAFPAPTKRAEFAVGGACE